MSHFVLNLHKKVKKDEKMITPPIASLSCLRWNNC